MGSGVYGWTLLDDVPIWYELWRQLNGFPPNFLGSPGAGKSDKNASKAAKAEEKKEAK